MDSGAMISRDMHARSIRTCRKASAARFSSGRAGSHSDLYVPDDLEPLHVEVVPGLVEVEVAVPRLIPAVW